MVLRPLDGETGKRRKRDSELHPSEKKELQRAKEKSDWLRRNGRGTEGRR